ncbi:TPA: histidine phosphatase family protein [Stenotrophomonas maltophilia]|jgi:phosphohistidine phosphatase SixA|uniref:Phosphoglycerate mutase n=1 Tax=Stenotrophomonas maltophilia TaxID=40324 RepID=A0A2J0UAW2_STEMA|nr:MULTISPECIES: histidine phosphatase family protein [Stenotrophomonas]HCT28808.1 histidine phosphatase family protein [Stenotrophomonas sp.]PJL28186.1 phosphoglycerate mutase [Stenotrophomonas maltophilia]HDS1138920.1 histidine phosphatase family protein [Stenotrophomonas maltophilia]HDS1144999.1 histidine phosphatase family protein [Stenotrophomonas maltophilia]HDS1162392.1 histidine phosphatase family protein [Stenotrophomonas maltophilia]
MRELILLRHAHAEPAVSGQADLDRPLSPVGLAEAEAAGKWLKENNLLPDCVMCSPSRRTRETLEAVMTAIGYVEKRLEDRIYEATPGTLAALVDERRDLDRVLIVGHNPGLEQLVALMTDGTSSDYRGMPPGGVAVLGFPREAAIEPGVASLNAFWWP